MTAMGWRGNKRETVDRKLATAVGRLQHFPAKSESSVLVGVDPMKSRGEGPAVPANYVLAPLTLSAGTDRLCFLLRARAREIDG